MHFPFGTHWPDTPSVDFAQQSHLGFSARQELSNQPVMSLPKSCKTKKNLLPKACHELSPSRTFAYDFIFLEVPKKGDSNELVSKTPQLGQKHLKNNSRKIRIFRSRCSWVGYFSNNVEQQLLPLHKQKKFQTSGAGKELHICTSLRPDGDKRLHLVGKGVPSWPGK